MAKTNNIIFLDFDGPLYPLFVHLFPENKNPEYDLIHPFISYWKMDPTAVAMLNELNERFKFDAVLSTSWCSLVSEKDAYERLFEANGLKLKLHEDWMTPRHRKNREEQIEDWILTNKPNNYVILDDKESGDNIVLSEFIDQSKVFIVDYNNGILYKDYQRLLDIMMKWKYGDAYEPIDADE